MTLPTKLSLFVTGACATFSIYYLAARFFLRQQRHRSNSSSHRKKPNLVQEPHFNSTITRMEDNSLSPLTSDTNNPSPLHHTIHSPDIPNSARTPDTIETEAPSTSFPSAQEPLSPPHGTFEASPLSPNQPLTAASASPQHPDSQNLLNLLYAIAEDQARKEGYVHRGITCNNCNSSPIRGIRYKCGNCVDYDLCENCESFECHFKTHVFIKIRIPIPPLANPRSALLNLFYPGKDVDSSTLTWDKIRDLQRKTHFDQVELEALYEQFKSLSTSQERGEGGINRDIFEQCLGPLGLEKNLITDRIFSFFDQDKDNLINFSELVTGLSILCKGTLEEKVKYAFMGYDLDGDGLISRDELRKMFKAYFHLSMELVRDVVKAMEEEMMINFDDQGNKPVSAAFTAPIPSTSQNGSSTSTRPRKGEEYQDDSPTSPNDSNWNQIGPAKKEEKMIKKSVTINDYVSKKPTLEEEPEGRLPVIEAMSQDALEEMVEKTFCGAECEHKGYISYEDFKRFAENDTTMISWFEALGSVF